MTIFPFAEHAGLCKPEQEKEFRKLMALDGCPKMLSHPPKAKSIKDVKYLGIFKEDDDYKAHYYIGASWLIKDKHAFVVKPKIDNVDYINLFMTALKMNSENEAEYFSNYYYIDFNEPAIKTDSLDDVITPLLILHYISLLRHLVTRGLKKGYVVKEENLQSKIRGRILLQKHLTKNVFTKREDHVYCRFQEFTEDIPENRILKKALSFSVRFINGFESFKNHVDELNKSLSFITPAFENISEDVTISQVAKINAGKIFRHYEGAIKVAKMILRHFDYSIDKMADKKHEVRPFCIDMPRLYEMYVLSLLRKAYGDTIRFQARGRHKTMVDFIKTDEKIIMDAKYKPHYDKGNAGIVDDVREISGYARDKSILRALGWYKGEAIAVDGKLGKLFPDCVIIYPIIMPETNDDGESVGIQKDDCKFWDGSNLPEKIINKSRPEICNPIDAFEGFYKMAIPLPKK